MKNYLIGIVVVLISLSCTQKKEMHITEISQKDINSGIILDVRTPEEYEEGHLENAVNINWYDPDFKEQAAQLDSKKTLFVYCKKGGRSTKAAAVLDSLGYKTTNLLGGYDAWKEAN